MDAVKQNIAKNIAGLRTASGMTQAELAEKLSYSDKSVSKWERAESIPDVLVLKQLANLFGVTVDSMLASPDSMTVPSPVKKTKRSNRIITTVLAMLAVWLIAVIAFTVLWAEGTIQWRIFVYGVPATLFVLFIFNLLWGKRKANVYIVSGFIWTSLASIYLSVYDYKLWLLFVIGVPLQAAVILAAFLKRTAKDGGSHFGGK